jgi:taurine transport system substrate-binding protein
MVPIALSSRRTAAAALLAAVLVAAACGGTSGSTSAAPGEDPKGVQFKMGAFVAPTVLMVGQAQGNFSNLSLSTFDLDSGATAVSLMANGTLAGASDISEPPINIAYSKDIKTKIVWLSSFTPGDLVVKPGITDLRGKKIASPGGSLTEYLLEQYLDKHGLKLSDIQYTDLSAPDATAAFKAGAIDGAYLYSPFTEAMQSAGGQSIDKQRIYNYIVFSQQFIDAHPSVVQAFVCDMSKTQTDFVANPSPGWALLSAKLGIKVDDLKVSMPANSVAPPDQMLTAQYMGTSTTQPQLASQVAGIGAWMVKQGRVPKAPSADDAAKLFDRTFVEGSRNGRCH